MTDEGSHPSPPAACRPWHSSPLPTSCGVAAQRRTLPSPRCRSGPACRAGGQQPGLSPEPQVGETCTASTRGPGPSRGVGVDTAESGPALSVPGRAQAPLLPAAPSSATALCTGRVPPEPSPPREVWTATAPSEGPGARAGKRRPPCPGAAAPVLGDQDGWYLGGHTRLVLRGQREGWGTADPPRTPAGAPSPPAPRGLHEGCSAARKSQRLGASGLGEQPSTRGTAA